MKKILIALLLPCALLAQTNIYRSLQPGVTSAIGTSTGTLTISGSTATFSVAQPDSVGVGDAIQYDSDGNSSIDAIAFIHGRTSSTVYTVAAANGGTPTGVSGDEDHDIFRAYTSIASVEGGTENTGIDASVRAFDGAARNLDSNAEIFNLAIYAGTEGNDTTIDWDSWDTSATEYINIFAPFSESHVGISQKHRYSTRYKLLFDLAASIDLTGHVRIDGLIFLNYTNDMITFESSTTGGDWRLSNCIIAGQGSNLQQVGLRLTGLSGQGNGGSTVRVWNCIFYGLKSTDGGNDGTAVLMSGNQGNEPNTYFFNNTIVDCDRGYQNLFNGGLLRFTNNVVMDCTDSWAFTSLHAASDYNITDNNDPLWENNDIMSTQLTFVNAGSRNYHLTLADAAIAIGTDLSGDANLPFSTDIDNDTRTTWNMGADEYIAVGGRKRKKPIWWSEYHEKDFIDWLLALR